MNHMLSNPRAQVALVLSLACSTAAAQSQMSQYAQVVQAVGDPVAAIPGATISATSNFDFPIIDQRGTVLYRARMAGAVTGVDDRAYFMGRASGDVHMVVRAGDQAPGCPAGTLLRNNSASGSSGLTSMPRISPFGEILFFQSALYDPINSANTPTTADSALFWGTAVSLMLLSREGDQVPYLADLPTYGVQTFFYQNDVINSSGQVVFMTTLVVGSGTPAVTSANDTVMFTGVPGNLSVVSREGSVLLTGEVVIPVSGSTISSIVQINEGGMVLHDQRFSTAVPSTATTANDSALAIWVGGNDIIVAREGQQAPGLPAGVLFATPSLNWTPAVGPGAFTRSGNMLLLAGLDGGGTSTSNDSALFFGGLNGWQPVLRKGDLCPGLANGEQFGAVGNASMMCDDAGHVTFIATLTGASVTAANDTSIWVGTPGNLTMLAREGDLAPGLVPSVNGAWHFEQIFQGSQTPYLVDGGAMLWQASVTDGVTTGQGAWYSYTPTQGLRVLAQPGTDSLTTALGTGAWINTGVVGTFNSGDGGPVWVNNRGDFAVKANIAGAPTSAIVRGHVGAMVATPSSVPVATGGTQAMHLDAGPANAGNLYIVVGSLSGTRPGFDFGGQHVPLNMDGWFNLTLQAANSAVLSNTMGVLDAQGRATAFFNFPSGYPAFAGTHIDNAFAAINGSGIVTMVSEPASLFVY
jgi:hypothetical protein